MITEERLALLEEQLHQPFELLRLTQEQLRQAQARITQQHHARAVASGPGTHHPATSFRLTLKSTRKRLFDHSTGVAYNVARRPVFSESSIMVSQDGV